MDILLDTQVLLWAQSDSRNLSPRARQLLVADDVFKWVTPISYFEIAMKHKIGKLPNLGLLSKEFFYQVKQDGFKLLSLTTEHIAAYDQIPFFEDHRESRSDVSVRPAHLATALHEGWPVMSADYKFNWYKDQVSIVW